jgi:1-phosphatidylinositol phosphodiesterase
MTVNAASWMSAIDDSVPLSRLSILGSHESCALEGAGPTQCQALSIPEQLNRGVRFLDIRCVYAHDAATDFPIMHGGVIQGIKFEQVQQECRDFLEKHRDETIIMNVQQEHNPVLRNRSPESFLARFLELMHRTWWAFPDQAGVPTLADCRGRIFLVRAYDSVKHEGWPSESADHKLPGHGGLPWNGFCHDGVSENKYFATQNGWDKYETSGDGASNGWDAANKDKLAAIKEHMNKAAEAAESGGAKIYVNFTSRAAGAYVGSAAEVINKKLVRYLENDFPQRFPAKNRVPIGVVAIDFVGNTGVGEGCLENRILQHNPFTKGEQLVYT